MVAGYPPQPGALRQAFERDKRTLRDGGIPIAVERLDSEDQVGYRILPEEYYLPDLGLSKDEQEALVFALAAVRLEGGVGRDVAAKLGSSISSDLAPIALLPSLPALGTLQEAIRLRRAASFLYKDRQRLVEGYGLVFKQGSWYFVGLDRSVSQAGELRTFRVDRIASPIELKEPASYALPEGVDASRELSLSAFSPKGPAASDQDDALEVSLAVEASEVSLVASLVGRAAIQSRGEDGSVRFHFPVADEAAFVSFVLGRGDAVEVLSPNSLRTRVIKALEHASKQPTAIEAVSS